jgi:MFS family permease
MANKKWPIVVSLGFTQTLAWASTYYLPAILAVPISQSLEINTSEVNLAFSAALVVSAIFGPLSGKAIDLWGGQKVLPISNILFAIGLTLLGYSSNTQSLWIAWLVIGLGMSGGLYESAFSTIVQFFGKDSRASITGVTLFAGFASTIGWPISGWLFQHWGWRETCWTWACIHIVVGLPLNSTIKIFVDQTLKDKKKKESSYKKEINEQVNQPTQFRKAIVLSFVFASTWFTSTAMAAHWPRLLEINGLSSVNAIAIGALIGPSQVLARIFEFGILRKIHPLLSARLASLAHPIGAVMLILFGPGAAPFFAILHGAGNGVLTIAKGTLPLVMFGEKGYGYRQGWIMFPARISSAIAPWLFGICISEYGKSAITVTMTLGLISSLSLFLIDPKKR